MFKIEFPAERTDIALAIGQALVAIGKGEALVNSPAASTAPKSADTATASAGETVRTTAADTATDQDNPAANDSALAHGATDQAGSADTNAPADAGANGAGDTGKNDPAFAGGDQTTTAASQDKTAGTTTASGATSTDRDEKGVAKDPRYCANAASPFYGSGKRKGQWKKRQGVDEAEYDAWYAEQLAAVETEPAPEAEFDTSNAFGGAQTNNPDSDMPQDGGAFATWVSEHQAAGNITPADVDAAWEATGSHMGLLFTGSLIKENIAAMYYTLKYGINSPQAQQAMQALV